MACPEHIEIVKRGARAIQEWRTKNRHKRLELGHASLGGASLAHANLRDANLGDADLGSADLRGVNLSWANLKGADLGCAASRFGWPELSRF